MKEHLVSASLRTSTFTVRIVPGPALQVSFAWCPPSRLRVSRRLPSKFLLWYSSTYSDLVLPHGCTLFTFLVAVSAIDATACRDTPRNRAAICREMSRHGGAAADLPAYIAVVLAMACHGKPRVSIHRKTHGKTRGNVQAQSRGKCRGRCLDRCLGRFHGMTGGNHRGKQAMEHTATSAAITLAITTANTVASVAERFAESFAEHFAA